MTKKRKVTYYAFHAGTGTLIDAADDTFVFSDEDFTDEELDAVEDGDEDFLGIHALVAGVPLMRLIRLYEKKCAEETARARKKRKKGRK